jgi:hypothetical protein
VVSRMASSASTVVASLTQQEVDYKHEDSSSELIQRRMA